jgi:hypothetical protein
VSARAFSRALGFAVASIAAVSTPVHAYRNPDKFLAPAAEGGGGGKFFTGSRAEGYTCSVCHTPGKTVPVVLSGLPQMGYFPGQTYPITVDWPDELRSVSLNVELTDLDGNAFGELIVPDPAELSPADLCLGEVPSSAGQAMVELAGRRVVTIAECEQHQTTLHWRAPMTVGAGIFAGSLIVSNRDGKLRGDSVADFSSTIGMFGDAPPPLHRYTASCAVVLEQQTDNAFECMLGVLCALAWRVLLRRRGVRSIVRTVVQPS